MRTVLVSFVPSIRKHWVLLVCTAASLMTGILVDALYPYLLRRLIETFTSGTPEIGEVKASFYGIVCLLVSGLVIWRLFDCCIAFFELKVIAELEMRCFDALQAQDMRFHDNEFSGSLVKRVSRYTRSFEGLADTFFFQIGRDGMLLIITFGIFVREKPLFAAVFGAWALVFVAMNIVLALWKYPIDEKEALSDSAKGAVLTDSLGSHRTVKSYAREPEERARYQAAVDENTACRKRAWLSSTGIQSLQACLMTSFQIFLLWYLIDGWERGTVTVADFVFFQSYVVWIFSNLWHFGHAVRQAFRFSADGKEMTETLKRVPDIRDAAGAVPLTLATEGPVGEIRYENLRFSYDNGRTHQVNGFSLRIRAGSRVGLLGRSGAGKTTLVSLLLRYYAPQSGCIRIDGQDIALVSQRSLRGKIAVVSQRTDLFHRTLRENIAFGKPGATDDAIIAAAKKAHIWEFIQRQPKGLDTYVGERGVKLSGGEQQRISIARAILSDAPIIILDEATSALDSHTEQLIQAALEDLLRGRTAIVIAHRLSTLDMLDHLIVLEHGMIAEEGTQQELMARGGIYADLRKRQSGGYLREE